MSAAPPPDPAGAVTGRADPGATPAGALALPPLAQARVVAAYAQAALDQARAALGERALLAQPVNWHAALPATIGVGEYIALLENAARLSQDPAFGLHVGERMRPATFATYGHVVLSCPDFGAALRQTQRFEALAHDLGRSELRVEGDTAIYRWHCPWLAALPSRHLPESVLAGIISFANWLACERVPLDAVAFVHPARPAAPPAEYQRLFAAPVRFAQPLTEARFPARVLDIRLPSSDRDLFDVVERHASAQLRERALAITRAGIVGTVRQCLLARLAHEPVRIEDIARAIDLSVRSLQRKLAAAGVSYAQVLDATRRELAARYLQDSRRNLTEIAFLLGYREQSSFNRAHRTWHGCSPQQWRARRVRDGDADEPV